MRDSVLGTLPQNVEPPEYIVAILPFLGSFLGKRDFKDFHQAPTQPKSGPLAVSLIFNLNTSKNIGR